jgi:hypothetical protein
MIRPFAALRRPMMIRKLMLSALAALALAGHAMADITFGGGDGTSPETAIVILGAEGSSDGVASEYDWIGKMRPGAQILEQALIQNGERFYDAITIRVGGADEVIYFDITDFFGKY